MNRDDSSIVNVILQDTFNRLCTEDVPGVLLPLNVNWGLEDCMTMLKGIANRQVWKWTGEEFRGYYGRFPDWMKDHFLPMYEDKDHAFIFDWIDEAGEEVELMNSILKRDALSNKITVPLNHCLVFDYMPRVFDQFGYYVYNHTVERIEKQLIEFFKGHLISW